MPIAKATRSSTAAPDASCMALKSRPTANTIAIDIGSVQAAVTKIAKTVREITLFPTIAKTLGFASYAN
jgi:hypothetical protein